MVSTSPNTESVPTINIKFGGVWFPSLSSPRLPMFLLRTNKLNKGQSESSGPLFVCYRGFAKKRLEVRLGYYRADAAFTKSAQRSPIMMLGALVLPLMILGITLASATHNPSTPLTFKVGSTTASASLPIRHVPTG